jgi:hypothetical protein
MQVQALLQAQLVLSAEEHDGTPVNATGAPSRAPSPAAHSRRPSSEAQGLDLGSGRLIVVFALDALH